MAKQPRVNRHVRIGTAIGRVGTADPDGRSSEEGFPIQVKLMDKVGRTDIDAFEDVMEREDEGSSRRGVFVRFGHTRDAEHQCAAFCKHTARVVKLLAIREMMSEEHVQKI